MERFGERYHKHGDNDESIWFYEFPDFYEWNIEFDPAGNAKCLIFNCDPILDKDGQCEHMGQRRIAPYGVDDSGE
ncbi:MAG: hypothetical protein CMO80_13970 [Verrucomicrobiales bacterium]|nr:hypothetical protein [Verrucomicrobiales bacterium]